MTQYEERLQSALARLADDKAEVEFLKLQIKQEKKQAKWAKESPVLKQFKAQWPELTIDNGAGMTYLGLHFAAHEEYEQHIPFGWECYDTRKVHDGLGSPIVKIYRMRHVPALLYVTKAIC